MTNSRAPSPPPLLLQRWFVLLSLLYSSIIFITLFNATAAEPNANNERLELCQLPLKRGNCAKKLTRFYYDPLTMRCSKFIYSGCNGNENRFRTRNLCKRKCHPYFRMSAVLQTERNTAESDRKAKDCAQNCARTTGGVCVNGVCQCKDGHEKRDGKCIDPNACDFISCERNAKCVNLAGGSFRCKCLKGFAGSGFNCTKNRRICAQPFDVRYEHQCQPDQRWEPRFFFHLASGQCRRFWYGGCQFGSRQNFFHNKRSCASFCAGYSHAEYFADTGAISQHTAPGQNAIQRQQQRKNNFTDFFCLDRFDETLRRHCAGGLWERRYYFDASIGRCRQFWMDTSCPSPRAGGSRSRNIFVHVQICRRLCEGNGERSRDEEGTMKDDSWVEAWSSSRNRTAGFIQASFARSTTAITSSRKTTTTPKTTTDPSVMAQMSEVANECALVRLSDQLALAKTGQEKRQKMSKLKAKLGKTKQQWKHEEQWKKQQQQQLWHSNAIKKGKSDACLDRFDWNLAKSCGHFRWRARFFYDARLGKCRSFWHDGCLGQTRNNFREEKTCRKKCELLEEEWDEGDRRGGIGKKGGTAQESRAVVEASLHSSTICVQPFDDIYRRACNNGKSWRRKWYFDALNGFCRHFWYDGCIGRSHNIFDGLKQCMDMCVNENDFVLLDQSLRTDKRPKFAYFEAAQPTVLIPNKNYLKSSQIWLDEQQCAGFRYNLTGNALLSVFLCLLEEGGSCQRTVHPATIDGEKCHFGRSWLKGRHLYAWFFTLEKGRPSSADGTAMATTMSSSLQSLTSDPATANMSMTTIDIAGHSPTADDEQEAATTTVETVPPPTDQTTETTAAELLALVEQQPQQQWRTVGTASAVLTLRQPQLMLNGTTNSEESMVVPIELFGRHNETVATVELFIAPIEHCNADTNC